MMQRFGMALGAGLAAALLFAVMAKGTLASMMLAYLAPLPIMIATLGWGLDAGAIAGAVGCGVAAAVVDPISGALFAASVALPSWSLGFLSLFPRERLFPFAASPGAEKTWLPVGAIVAAASLFGAMIGLGAFVSLMLVYDGYDKGVAAIAADLVPDLKDALDGVTTFPGGLTVEEFAALVVRLAPTVLAAATCLMLCANLYGAARAVQLSHRLKRPWPNLPETLALPQALGLCLVALTGIAFAASGVVGQIAWIGVGALGAAYVMQGLAVIHSLSRPLPARAPMLVGLYLICGFAARWCLPLLAIVGLVESLLSLRARRAAAANAKL